MKPIENVKILIVAPLKGFPGWGYRANYDKVQFGGSSVESAVHQAYERCLVDEDDDVHVCRETGIEIKKVGTFVNPVYNPEN